MCGRFTNLLSWRELIDLYRLTLSADGPVEWRPRYNGAPTQRFPVLRVGADGARELALMRWGLIPSWARDPKIGNSLINARAETVAEKPAFRAAFRSRRCLIPADGFYEWRRLAGGGKQPYRIGLSNGGPFSFAGLWERWDGGPEPLETFTIVTDMPNDLVQSIHNRMPVIVGPGDYDAWLAGDGAAARALLRPFPATRMRAYPVSSRVGSPRNDDPALIEPVEG